MREKPHLGAFMPDIALTLQLAAMPTIFDGSVKSKINTFLTT